MWYLFLQGNLIASVTNLTLPYPSRSISLSVPRGMEPSGTMVPPGNWMDVVVQRFNSEPWALGAAVVMAVFVLGILALAVFAFLFGCCCTPKEKRKKSRDAVL